MWLKKPKSDTVRCTVADRARQVARQLSRQQNTNKNKIPASKSTHSRGRRVKHCGVYILNDDAPRIKTAEKQKKPKPCFFFLLLLLSAQTKPCNASKKSTELMRNKSRARLVRCLLGSRPCVHVVCSERCRTGSKTPRAASTHINTYTSRFTYTYVCMRDGRIRSVFSARR